MPDEDRPLSLGSLLGVVFDLDGTLVTSGHDFKRMRHEVIRIAERHGVTPGHLSVRDTIPRIMELADSELALGGVPEGDRFRFEAEVNTTIDAIELEALPKTVARAGAGELLKALSAKGYRLAVLTRSSEQFCRRALAKTGLLDYFPDLRTRSSPGPPKPSPEALLLLLKQMEVAPDRCLFIGDHPLDAECATRARIRFIGVLEAAGPPDLADRLKRGGAMAVAADLPGLGRLLGVPSPRPAAAPGMPSAYR
ncbi:MAG TPA: HAD family hydrolase [Thermoplasmata archaeon]|nr:HAD family hydrolase [Thermoplasmata archaeon]